MTNAAGKVIRELTGPAPPAPSIASTGICGIPLPSGDGGAAVVQAVRARKAAMTPAGQRAGVVQLPIPPHEIGPRGPHVAPGTFKVTLEVDGVAAGSQTFEVRADPESNLTLAQHKAREAFVVEVMDLLGKIDKTDRGPAHAARGRDRRRSHAPAGARAAARRRWRRPRRRPRRWWRR